MLVATAPGTAGFDTNPRNVTSAVRGFVSSEPTLMPADPSHRKLRTIGYFCCAGIAYSAISYPTLLHSTPRHSHSIVPGGLLVTSYTTRFTPFTSLMIRVAVS